FTNAKCSVGYSAAMSQPTDFQLVRLPFRIWVLATLAAIAPLPQLGKAQQTTAQAQQTTGDWTFAVSGDSRNCGDFVMPAIAAKVKAEKDTFYWHLGDFRWITMPDEDFLSME